MPWMFVVLVGVLLVAGVLLWSGALQVSVHGATRVSVKDLRSFSRAFNERTVEHMRVSYGGDPAQLETALRGLVPIARGLAQDLALPLDDDLLRTVVVTAVVGNRFATRQQVVEALDEVLRRESRAA